MKVIKELPKNKARNLKDILIKIMDNAVHIYPGTLTKIFNDCKKRKVY